jgi:hypothetical protein
MRPGQRKARPKAKLRQAQHEKYSELLILSLSKDGPQARIYAILLGGNAVPEWHDRAAIL